MFKCPDLRKRTPQSMHAIFIGSSSGGGVYSDKTVAQKDLRSSKGREWRRDKSEAAAGRELSIDSGSVILERFKGGMECSVMAVAIDWEMGCFGGENWGGAMGRTGAGVHIGTGRTECGDEVEWGGSAGGALSRNKNKLVLLSVYVCVCRLKGAAVNRGMELQNEHVLAYVRRASTAMYVLADPCTPITTQRHPFQMFTHTHTHHRRAFLHKIYNDDVAPTHGHDRRRHKCSTINTFLHACASTTHPSSFLSLTRPPCPPPPR